MCLFYLLLVPFIFSKETSTFEIPKHTEKNIPTHLIQIINSLDNSQINVVTFLKFNKIYSINADDTIDDTIGNIRKDILVVLQVNNKMIHQVTRMLIVFYEDGLFKVNIIFQINFI